jgi:hypothetical protein
MATPPALMTASALLVALAVGGTAFAAPDDHASIAARSGGALAEPQPTVGSKGGGNLAPAGAETAAAASEAGDSGADARLAQAGQEEPPATPGGEHQSGAEPLADERAVTEVAPAAEELAAPVADTGAGDLPSTGVELAAMATIGLGLLMLGAALRPRPRQPAGRR